MLSALLLSLLVGTTLNGEREVQNTPEPPIAGATSAPKLEMPAQIQAQPGQVFCVKADTNLKWKRWSIPTGLVRVPPEFTKFGDDAFVGYGPAGVYEFKLEGTASDVYKEGKTVVFVGQPTPGPAPGPAPVDPFTAELQPLFTADKGTAEQRDKFCELWRSAAVQVEGNRDFKTMSDFTTKMRGVAEAFPFELTDDMLRQIRTKMANDLTAVCGPGVTELGPPKSECRKKAAALLVKYANALGGVK